MSNPREKVAKNTQNWIQGENTPELKRSNHQINVPLSDACLNASCYIPMELCMCVSRSRCFQMHKINHKTTTTQTLPKVRTRGNIYKRLVVYIQASIFRFKLQTLNTVWFALANTWPFLSVCACAPYARHTQSDSKSNDRQRRIHCILVVHITKAWHSHKQFVF